MSKLMELRHAQCGCWTQHDQTRLNQSPRKSWVSLSPNRQFKFQIQLEPMSTKFAKGKMQRSSYNSIECNGMEYLIKSKNLESNLVWKENIGSLPGSFLQFKRSHSDELELITGDSDQKLIHKRQRMLRDSTEEVQVCSKCFTFGLTEEFVKNGKYCKKCSMTNIGKLKLFSNLSQTYAEYRNENFNFEWEQYLKKYKYKCVPLCYFSPKQLYPVTENSFKPGMILEGVDPYEPQKFRIFSISEVVGYRLKLHFEGNVKKPDFWVDANSDLIFPIGFCDKHERKIDFDLKNESLLDWKQYLSCTNLIQAPENIFSKNSETDIQRETIMNTGFKIGQKLEAVNRKNRDEICIATIIDILGEYLLIHLDDFDDSYNYWAPVYSQSIHPIEWCRKNGLNLLKLKDAVHFSWHRYLKSTNSTPAPSTAFNQAKSKYSSLFLRFKPGFKLEVVDRSNPQLVRVGTIIQVDRHFRYLKIHYDGLSDKLDFVDDLDSPDLHPVYWCLRANHNLYPPPEHDDNTSNSCSFLNCYDEELIKTTKFSQQVDVDLYQFNSKCQPRVGCSQLVDSSTNELCEDQLIDKCLQLNQIKSMFLEYFKRNNSPTFLKSNIEFLKTLSFDFKNVFIWNNEVVCKFVSAVTNDPKACSTFETQRVDGLTLITLNTDDLIYYFHLKLGSALKIHSFVVTLQFILFDCEAFEYFFSDDESLVCEGDVGENFQYDELESVWESGDEQTEEEDEEDNLASEDDEECEDDADSIECQEGCQCSRKRLSGEDDSSPNDSDDSEKSEEPVQYSLKMSSENAITDSYVDSVADCGQQRTGGVASIESAQKEDKRIDPVYETVKKCLHEILRELFD